MNLSKDIKATLYDRAVSPFWRTFWLVWLIINWELWYVTFFETKETLGMSVIEYIKAYVSYEKSEGWSVLKLYILPLASSIVSITLFQYFTNWIYKIDLKFKKKRVQNKKIALGVQEEAELLEELKETKEENINLKKEIESLKKGKKNKGNTPYEKRRTSLLFKSRIYLFLGITATIASTIIIFYVELNDLYLDVRNYNIITPILLFIVGFLIGPLFDKIKKKNRRT